MQTKIKICGLTKKEEVAYLANQIIAYAGIVMFYPKSRRNNTPESAKPIISALKQLKNENRSLKAVAVTVSPTLEQLRVIESLDFDIIQIHGYLNEEIPKHAKIPIFLARNMSKDFERNNYLSHHNKIKALLFDGKTPGNGEVFDWNILKEFYRGDKLLILAGGLDEYNVAEGIRQIHPDIVDVSTGVEYLESEKKGKDPQRIMRFIKAVMDAEEQYK